ncbi:MAG: hypothetical protein WCS43_02720 [Verrucomicrobiota bacterium]
MRSLPCKLDQTTCCDAGIGGGLRVKNVFQSIRAVRTINNASVITPSTERVMPVSPSMKVL